MLRRDVRLAAILLLSPWLALGQAPSSVPIVFAGTSTAGSMDQPTNAPINPLSSPSRPAGQGPSPTSTLLGTTASPLATAGLVSPSGSTEVESIQGLSPTSLDMGSTVPTSSSTTTSTSTLAPSNNHPNSLIITLPAVLGTACILAVVCLSLYFSRACRAKRAAVNRHASPIGDDEIETWRVASEAGHDRDSKPLSRPSRTRAKHSRVPSAQRESAAPSEKPIEEYAAAVVPKVAFVPRRPPVLINIAKAPNGSRSSENVVMDDNPFATEPSRLSSVLDTSAGSLSIEQSDGSTFSRASSGRPLTSQLAPQPPPRILKHSQNTEEAEADNGPRTPDSCCLPSRPGSFDFEIDFDTAPTSPKKIG